VAERLVALEGELPAFLAGQMQPRDNEETLGLARVAGLKKRYLTAARLFVDAFASDSKLADDLKAGHRYNAACYAALAGKGQGQDAAGLDDKERSRWRKQALAWLRADLARRTQQLKSGETENRKNVQQTLQHWQRDPDLAGLRDKDAVAKLSADEQDACKNLWADVAVLVKRAQEVRP
jgi:serine/threonine-protein kinase